MQRRAEAGARHPRRWLALSRSALLAALLCAGFSRSFAQTSADVEVHLQHSLGAWTPAYSWFGYDESNYTTTPNGKALLQELHDLTPAPVYVRAHFLLTSGNGKPELKWSSSNVYTEDASGKPVYDWAILDGIFDAWVHAGVRPYVELGFMPKALSSHPEPYHIAWPVPSGQTEGWSYPPTSYSKWEELIHQIALHMVARYGMAEVSRWYWEVWNEPDIFYWHGTEPQYEKLYDYAVAGVRSAIPTAHVGGPATTGPTPGSRSAEWLREFLRHCAHDRSSATGGTIPLDFISFHAKGSLHMVEGHLQMGLGAELQNAATGFAIVHASEKFRHLPVVLSEADPEGCGACDPRHHPEVGYRNGTLYPAYTAAAMQALLELARRNNVNLIGFLTWAFEFEGQPIFAGQRALATHGIDKPELNFFRMAGLLENIRVAATSSAAIPAIDILHSGVRQRPEVDAVATRSSHSASVLLWNYEDNVVAAPGTTAHLTIQGIPAAAHRVLVLQYRIDRDHSNAFTAWQRMGSPQQPTPAQLAELQAAGQLQMDGSPRWQVVDHRRLRLQVDLPPDSLLLVRLSWSPAG